MQIIEVVWGWRHALATCAACFSTATSHALGFFDHSTCDLMNIFSIYVQKHSVAYLVHLTNMSTRNPLACYNIRPICSSKSEL